MNYNSHSGPLAFHASLFNHSNSQIQAPRQVKIYPFFNYPPTSSNLYSSSNFIYHHGHHLSQQLDLRLCYDLSVIILKYIPKNLFPGDNFIDNQLIVKLKLICLAIHASLVSLRSGSYVLRRTNENMGFNLTKRNNILFSQ